MISRTMQEWSDFTGMVGTISSTGVILLHENEPEKIKGEYAECIYKATGAFVAIPRELVIDRLNYSSLTRPSK